MQIMVMLNFWNQASFVWKRFPVMLHPSLLRRNIGIQSQISTQPATYSTVQRRLCSQTPNETLLSFTIKTSRAWALSWHDQLQIIYCNPSAISDIISFTPLNNCIKQNSLLSLETVSWSFFFHYYYFNPQSCTVNTHTQKGGEPVRPQPLRDEIFCHMYFFLV